MDKNINENDQEQQTTEVLGIPASELQKLQQQQDPAPGPNDDTDEDDCEEAGGCR